MMVDSRRCREKGGQTLWLIVRLEVASCFVILISEMEKTWLKSQAAKKKIKCGKL